MKNNIKIIFFKFLLIWFEFYFVTAKIEIGEDLATTPGKHLKTTFNLKIILKL